MGNSSSSSNGGGSGSNNSGGSDNPSREELEAALAGEAGAAAGGAGGGAEHQRQLSTLQQVKLAYASVIDAIIRPPRANRYNPERDLGPREFEFRGRVITRRDLILLNSKGQKLVASHWEPRADFRPASSLPCVIFLHGNSSSRVGCLENLETVLAEGATLLAFDFAGSGLSEGEWVTLGWNEREDVAAAVAYLRSLGTVSSIALWGRSMGAATALMHAHRDPSIAGMVLDSAFADLRQLALELVETGKAQTGYKIPSFIVNAAIRMVRSSVMKKAGGLDIFELSPIKDVASAFVPALFLAGEQDAFIQPHHSRQLYEKYGGDKNLLLVPGDHNSLRPKFAQDSAAIFLRQVLAIPDGFALEDSMSSRVRGLALRGLFATSDLLGGPVTMANAAANAAAAAGGGGSGGRPASSSSSLEAAWRASGTEGESAVASAAAARAKSAAAEEVMIRNALNAGSLRPAIITGSAGSAGSGAGSGAGAKKGVLSSTASAAPLPSPSPSSSLPATFPPSSSASAGAGAEEERLSAAAVRRDPGSIVSSLTDPGSVLSRREGSMPGEHGHFLSSSSSSSSSVEAAFMLPASLSIGPHAVPAHNSNSSNSNNNNTATAPSSSGAAPPSSPSSDGGGKSRKRSGSGSGGGGGGGSSSGKGWASAISQSMRSLLVPGSGGGSGSGSGGAAGSGGSRSRSGSSAAAAAAQQHKPSSSDLGDAFGGLDSDVAKVLPSRAPAHPQASGHHHHQGKGFFSSAAPSGSVSRLEIFAPRPPELPTRPSLPPPGVRVISSAVSGQPAAPSLPAASVASPTSSEEEADLQRALALSLADFTKKEGEH